MNERAAAASDYGTLEHVGDMSVLRYRRRLPHPIQMVWMALVEDDHLAAWFPTTIEGDRASGAPLRFSFREGEAEPFAGVMRVFDPPSIMELQWGDDTLRFELHAVEPGATVLDLVVDTVSPTSVNNGNGFQLLEGCFTQSGFVQQALAPVTN